MLTKINGRAALSILFLIVTIAAPGCNSSQSNSNRAAPQASVKPARWLPQFRSPSSLSYAGTNLAVFFYSGISVVSPNDVFVCGDMPLAGEQRVGVFLKTTDGGQTWTESPVQLAKIEIPSLNAIHFISPDVGWMVGVDSGDDGVVLKTTDAGSSWSVTRLSYKQIPVTVFFTDAQTGWLGGVTKPRGEEQGNVGGPSAILATTDGGSTWQPQYNVPVSVYRIFFVDKMKGWASATNGKIYNTSDGGRTWNSQRTEMEFAEGPVDLTSDAAKQFAMRSVHFADKDHGFAAASTMKKEPAGRVIATSDGGKTWRRTWIVADSGVRDVFLISANEGWALTERGPYAYHTVDGGRSWLSEPKVFEQDVVLARLGAADPSHVWAVGGGAIFFRVSE